MVMNTKNFIFLFVFIFSIATQTLSAEYGFMEIDGIRITIESIEMGTGGIDDFQSVASLYMETTVDLSSDDVNAAFDQELELFFTNEASSSQIIETIRIWLMDGVEIQAHIYIEAEDHFIYTTSSGLSTLDGSTWVEPVDYGFLAKDYIYFPADNGRTDEITFLVESIDLLALDSVDFSLLADIYKTVYYWDGTDADRLGFVKTVHENNPEVFPAGTPVVGLSYLPLYATINQDVIAETYVITNDNGDSSNNPILSPAVDGAFEADKVMFLTLTFDENTGEFYSGRSSNWDDFLSSYSWRFPQLVRRGVINGNELDLVLTNDFSFMPDQSEFDTISSFTRLNIGEESEATFGDQSESQSHDFDYKRVK